MHDASPATRPAGEPHCGGVADIFSFTPTPPPAPAPSTPPPDAPTLTPAPSAPFADAPTPSDSPTPTPPASLPDTVEVRRSSRRRKTIAGRIEGDRVIVMVPAHLSAQAEQRAVASMLEKLRKQQRRTYARQTMAGEELAAYVRQLDNRYCQGKARPTQVEWSRDVTSRWGSCNYRTRTIRLHPALATMPRYVLDYVIVHELCHLTVPGGHTDAFWEAVAVYPKAERARGYLEASSASLLS